MVSARRRQARHRRTSRRLLLRRVRRAQFVAIVFGRIGNARRRSFEVSERFKLTPRRCRIAVSLWLLSSTPQARWLAGGVLRRDSAIRTTDRTSIERRRFAAPG